MIHLINRFLEAVGIDAKHVSQLANGVCFRDEPFIEPLLRNLRVRLHRFGHQRTHHEILSERRIKDMPCRRIWVLVRMCLEQILLEGHVVLRLVSKPLTVAVNNTGARERLLHNRESRCGLVWHTKRCCPPGIIHQARFRTQFEPSFILRHEHVLKHL